MSRNRLKKKRREHVAKKRDFHELPYTESVHSGTIRLASEVQERLENLYIFFLIVIYVVTCVLFSLPPTFKSDLQKNMK